MHKNDMFLIKKMLMLIVDMNTLKGEKLYAYDCYYEHNRYNFSSFSILKL